MPDPYWDLLQKNATDSELIEAAIERIFNSHDFVLFVPTWSSVPKSQIDNTTIDEEIDLKIQDHDDDPDAHLDADQALQSHKASEIIDHVAKSIVSDKLQDWIELTAIGSVNRNDFHWFTIFESVDGYDVIGDVTTESNGLFMTTTAVTNNYAYLDKGFEWFYIPLLWSKKRRFKTAVFFSNSTNQDIHIGIGAFDPDEGKLAFHILDLHAYGVAGNGDSDISVDLGTITQDYHSLECVFTPGVSAEFYIDGILKGTITTGLPEDGSAAGSAEIIVVRIKTTANESKELVLFCWDFWQEA